ncbi:hypothetical protein ACLOJK_024488 [Asimina triloba]
MFSTNVRNFQPNFLPALMRTRFLNVEFFRLSPSKAAEISIFRLPIPQVFAPILTPEIEFSSFGLISSISAEIDQLPFENALSQFLRGVLPSTYDEFQKGNAISIVEETEDNCSNFASEALELELTEANASYAMDKNGKSRKNLQSDASNIVVVEEESVCTSDEQDGGILFEICNVRIPLDVLDNQLGDTGPYPHEISASVFSVEDRPAEQHGNQNYYVPESCSFSDGIPCPSSLLNFEISEIGLEPYSFVSREDEFHSILSSVEKRHWADKDDLMVDCKELLVPPNIDMLLLLGHDPSTLSLEPQPICLHSLIGMNFVSIKDGMDLTKPSAISLTTSEDCFFMESVIHFHEVEILDLEHPQSFQVFDSVEAASQSEMSRQILQEDASYIGSFYESIVNNELALVDDKFKSLPVPVLCDEKEKMYSSATFEDILDRVKMYPSSAGDGIYLDWHLLQVDTCNNDMCSTLQNLLERVDTYAIASNLKSMTDWLTNEFVFYDPSSDELNSKKLKETLTEVPAAVSVVNDALIEKTRGQLLKDENQKNKYGEPELAVNCEKVSMLIESMSQFNDLNFFLKARKQTAGRNTVDAIQDKSDKKIPATASCRGPLMTGSSSDIEFQLGDVEIHEVELSDHILSLIENIQKSFSAILKTDSDLKVDNFIFKFEDNSKLLSVPKKRLMNLIKEKSTQRITSSNEDGSLMAYIALYAIKQMVYYLCFYGIDSAYLYISNLSQSLRNMKSKLNHLLSLIEEANWKAEEGIIETHPSLFVVEEILGLNTSQRVRKVLVIAEKVFWRPLERKLNKMNISFYKVKNVSSCVNQPEILYTDEFLKSLQNALLQSDCIVISHEHVFPSFPFDKFGAILEYGGSCSTSRISSFSSKSVGLPCIHFVKVKVEEPDELRALCEESDESLHPEQTMEGISLPDWQGSSNCQQYVELLNFIPVMDTDPDRALVRVAYNTEASQLPDSMSSMFFTEGSEDIRLNVPSFPETVIIINTQSSDKEMLIFQRSSYRKILAMEKEGVQVVEREFSLPVDLIFSADVCLVWYDARNFRINSTSMDKASLCIPECMENIATNILMSLSFAFHSCALVFEGDRSFLTAIMESSDGLYAAAASLDMHLQLFCSYSSELTDEIILNCIRNTSKFNQGIYSPMPESETLAESFLTKFPSINPLSAHAILSSGGTLVEFLEWSKEQRIRVIGKYHVPEESIALFSALCKYGELGESKSVMTECSSALSSATEPEYSSGKTHSQRKKAEFSANNQSYDMPTAKCLPFKPFNRSEHSTPMFCRASWPYHPRVFPDCEEVIRKSKDHKFSLKETPLNKEQDFNSFFMEDLDWTSMFVTDVDVRGNTNDMHNMPLVDDYSCIANTGCVSSGAPHVPKEATGNHIVTENSSFSMCNLPMCPASTEIDSDLDIWFSLNDHKRKLEDNICTKLDTERNKEASHNKRQGEFLEESQMRKSTRHALGLSSKQKVTPPYGKTPVTNVTHLSQIQQRSPWAIEFLNKIKEKKDKNHQSLPCNTCVDCYGSSKKIDKFVKRESPSAIDSYRYQGSGSIKRTIQQKLYKEIRKPLLSVPNEKKDSAFDPTRTPIDKRARQKWKGKAE